MMGEPRSQYGVMLLGLLLLSLQRIEGWVSPSFFPLRELVSTRVVPKRMAIGPEASRRGIFSDERGKTRLYGVLSRSAILKHSSNTKRTGKKHNQPAKAFERLTRGSQSDLVHREDQPLTREFLLDALEEATYRQSTALECLELERKKLTEKVETVTHDELTQIGTDCESKNLDSIAGSTDNGDGRSTLKSAKTKRDPRTALNRVDQRRLQLLERLTSLQELRCDVEKTGSVTKTDGNNGTIEDSSVSISAAESRFRAILGSIAKPCPILDRPRDTWKIATEQRARESEFGRPRGFHGLVFYSPLGVPILVGKPKADSDEILRRVSQGSDLWFQVEDYDGSRVLLRSSLVRGTKDSKKCVQMAADLAAYFSVWNGQQGSYNLDTVPVMYTDSKHVAKRGTKVGRMRKRKSLGRLMGRPSSVEGIAKGLEPK